MPFQDYKTVEQCSIEYRPEMGACINPHIDDCWIWGERIVQLNLMSDTYLTLVPFEATEPMRYNLPGTYFQIKATLTVVNNTLCQLYTAMMS